MNNIIEDYWSDDYGYVEVLYLNGGNISDTKIKG